ncbi:hypothetical protein U9M48_041321 [Paspalum notatum var. saurae]|uniref:Cytochrome P450 n=1 Tax=Paspalum notatum var. saurae TaxID=547442 RepID=A0AAQ3XGE9_PASNO
MFFPARDILSTPMERLLQRRRQEEADHLLRFVIYSQQGQQQAGRLVNVRHVAQHFCGNMIRTLVFGKRHFAGAAGPGPGPEEEKHVTALFTLLNYLYNFSVSDYMRIPAAWIIGLDDLDGHEKVAKGVMKTLNRLHDPIIKERIHEWSSLRKSGGKREARDFLDVLVSLLDSEGQPILLLDEIRAQTLEMMFAIVDNPSNAVEWALAEMMNRPEVMQRAIAEVDTVVGKERLVQESDIPRLNYLKACIREAFRFYPYHAFNPPHVAMEDTVVSGYLIPKGSHVLVSRLGLGRSSDTWDAPLEFRPERHMMMMMMNNNDDDKSPYDDAVLLTEPDLRFISFSTGRRGCPGVSLGTSVTMMLFARLVHGFTWSRPPGVQTTLLKESTTNLALAELLILQAHPRLPLHLYADSI